MSTPQSLIRETPGGNNTSFWVKVQTETVEKKAAIPKMTGNSGIKMLWEAGIWVKGRCAGSEWSIGL